MTIVTVPFIFGEPKLKSSQATRAFNQSDHGSLSSLADDAVSSPMAEFMTIVDMIRTMLDIYSKPDQRMLSVSLVVVVSTVKQASLNF